MAARIKLYVDWTNRVLIQGTRNGSAFTLPKFFQGDIIPMQVYVLEPDANAGPNQYSFVDIDSMALKLAIGAQPTGSGVEAPFVTQFTWNKNLVGGEKYFYANVELNTSELDTWLGSAYSKNTAYLELELSAVDSITTIFQGVVTIVAEVIEAATGSVAGGETPLSMEVANQIFAKKFMNPGESITFPSKDGTKRTILYTDDDSSFHMDSI